MSLCDLLGIEPVVEQEDEVEEPAKKLSPFDFVTSISFTKENLFTEDDSNDKFYNAYIVNRTLSFSPDMVLFANEMNHHHQIPVKNQWEFLSSSIRKKKRYDKWVKAEKESETLTLIKTYYDYSNEKAKQVLPIITDDHIEKMKKKLDRGGLSKQKRK